jgi:hypothetical protein
MSVKRRTMMRWEMRKKCIRKPKYKRHLGRSGYRCENGIKIYLKEVGWTFVLDSSGPVPDSCEQGSEILCSI